eukprot:5466189-Amphidinium_carterae.1
MTDEQTETELEKTGRIWVNQQPLIVGCIPLKIRRCPHRWSDVRRPIAPLNAPGRSWLLRQDQLLCRAATILSKRQGVRP